MAVLNRREQLRKALELPESPCVMSKNYDPETAGEALCSDPAAWKPDFDRWNAERCVSRPGHEDSQSVGSLLLDFAEWCIAYDAVPADRHLFEQLLTAAGFPIKDGIAIGVMLRTDLEAVLTVPQKGMERKTRHV